MLPSASFDVYGYRFTAAEHGSRGAGGLYEATYLDLLSQIGQGLDRRGLHRIHALGIAL